jgi:hypothetical protein
LSISDSPERLFGVNSHSTTSTEVAMKYLCLIYYEEQTLEALSTREWDALIGGVSLRRGKARHDTLYLSGE